MLHVVNDLVELISYCEFKNRLRPGNSLETRREIHLKTVRGRYRTAHYANAEDAFAAFSVTDGQSMRSVNASDSGVQVMHPSAFVWVAKVVLVDDAGKPVRAPGVLGHNGCPIALVLLGK